MYLLAIETTGAFASVALLEAADTAGAGAPDKDEPRILGVIHGSDRFSHLQNLTPQIDQVLKENGLKAGDLTAIAVSHGPGSFTGIRIGVSTARALAQILKIPCIAVSSLEALALRVREIGEVSREDAAERSGAEGCGAERQCSAGRLLVCPALDARRKQVYGAAYELEGEALVCRIRESSCLMTEFLEKIDRYEAEAAGEGRPITGILFLGDGIDTCGEIIEAWAGDRPAAAEEVQPLQILYAPKGNRYQDAEAVAHRGLQLYRGGETCGFMDLQPEYLRMAEAERKLKDRMKKEQP